MARKKLSKRAKGRKLADEIEKLGERYLKRHRKLASMLKRKYVRSYELYEEPKEDVERIIRLMSKRLRMGIGLPKTRKGLITRLRKMTRQSIASLRQEIVQEQRDDYISSLVALGEDPEVVKQLTEEIEKIGWNKFLKSKYYLPLNNYGSPRLQRYLMQYGESPLITRMKDFINENKGLEPEDESEFEE
jgi:hypothetical protein